LSTITEVIEYLRNKDYVNNFEIHDGNLTCKETGESFTPGEMIIDEIHRFEGDSNPDDMSIIYALTAISGTRGVIIDAFGTYSDPEISEFIKKVSVKEPQEAG
jgi:hypothetical protein